MSDATKASDKDLSLTNREGNNERTHLQFLHRITKLLRHYGVETHGISPIPAEERTDTRWYQMFFVWFSSNLTIIDFGTGSAGPAFFSLGVRDAITIIVVTNLVACTFPAFFAVFGPKLGTRAMVQSRFSWGYYGSIIPSVLNVFTQQGFLVISCIIGGQTLASVSPHLDDTLGIVIISVITLVVTFFGYRFLHWFQGVAWIPNVIAFIAMLALGYPQLNANLYQSVPAPTTSSVISFTSTIAAGALGWSTVTPDYGVYHSPEASSTRIFLYTYLGLAVASIITQTLGAAFAAAAPHVPLWKAAFQDNTSVGGLLYGVLSPLGGFAKFLTVLVALTVSSPCAPTMYTFSTSLMSVAHWFALVPRWVYILISEAILIPVSIVGATRFYTTLIDMLSVIGYWTMAFIGIVFTDHIFFRRASFSEAAYPIATWDDPTLLPRNIPAVLAFICGFGALVPFMSQAWYVGPVAKEGSGDCGIYVAFVVSGLCYGVFRVVERCWGRRVEVETSQEGTSKEGQDAV